MFEEEDHELTALRENHVDLASFRLPDIQKYITYSNYWGKGESSEEGSDYIHVYYEDDDVRSYLALGSNIELSFNHKRFPLSEVWFRKACAYAIDYLPISIEAA